MELEMGMNYLMELAKEMNLELEVELKNPYLHNQSLVYNLVHYKFLTCKNISLYHMEEDVLVLLGIEP
jgi:hypothetical protein